MIKFGPAGNSTLFYDEGNKSSLEIPKWLKQKGLNAYEYQCGRGVRVKEKFSSNLKSECDKYGIALSLHAPYFINLASTDREKLDKSVGHITKSLKATSDMGGSKIVVHPGSVPKGEDRDEVLARAKEFLKEVLDLTCDYSHVKIGLELMGKINQLGNLSEVIQLCLIDPNRCVPVIDFGHLHAREHGGLKNKGDFRRVIDKIGENLGKETVKNLHIHFSPIEYSKGGEKKHRIFDEKEFGPRFEDFAPVVVENKMQPTIICESSGKQTEDALFMKKLYEDLID
ncbi:TIM barrel protein [Proteinivorax hydrogeniformans]|uniref:TIM barrel protein n=1 Tax=Proteinivorax hydrogeniformans TaxID=1826727 RepID=A0AAU8HVW2_9FIRM